MSRGYPTQIQKAFDEIRFGPARTLNLRETLPSADEARVRTEAWVRGKQMERAGELLIITGRGNNSEGGVSAVRQTILALFPSLRRRNIITGWQEHTPGSFVVTVAPLAALFEAPKRRREPRPLGGDPLVTPAAAELSAFAALSAETRALLRELAEVSLALLGVHDFERFIESEMIAKFETLSASMPKEGDPDVALRTALHHALDELEEQS